MDEFQKFGTDIGAALLSPHLKIKFAVQTILLFSGIGALDPVMT
jgi:hypothetical protein